MDVHLWEQHTYKPHICLILLRNIPLSVTEWTKHRPGTLKCNLSYAVYACYGIDIPQCRLLDTLCKVLCNTLLTLKHWVKTCCLGNGPPWPPGCCGESLVAPYTICASTPQRDREPTCAGEVGEWEGRESGSCTWFSQVPCIVTLCMSIECEMTQSVHSINTKFKPFNHSLWFERVSDSAQFP